MALDLWNFDERKLKSTTTDLPNNILKEQAELLAKKTGDMIYGRVTNMTFFPQDKGVKYKLASIFDAVVPSLDNYSYNLLILYSKPESDYPIAITVGSNMIDDTEDFRPMYECNNRNEFIEALKEILSSEEINNNIQVLYSKAVF